MTIKYEEWEKNGLRSFSTFEAHCYYVHCSQVRAMEHIEEGRERLLFKRLTDFAIIAEYHVLAS